MNNQPPLEKLRCQYQPSLPPILKEAISLAAAKAGQVKTDRNPDIAKLFPKTIAQPFLSFSKEGPRQSAPMKIGVVFSGGQAAGGHNVIAGLFDALKKLNPSSKLFGFLNGPSGMIENQWIELTSEKIAPYRNMGGFDLIGSGRTKIETVEQFQSAANSVKGLDLDGLVIIGGDDSNTNGAFLAEFFLEKGIKTKIAGVPKTIDGDLKNEFLEISFGFDTACKTYSDSIGSILRDSLSAAKYYFFIKLMGRSASHIALECALQTHPNLTLIGEEVESKNQTLRQIITEICDMIVERSNQKKDFGAVLIPEGIIEFIPECKILIKELNTLSKEIEACPSPEDKVNLVRGKLGREAVDCFNFLPEEIQIQLLLDRDPHGNVQVSKIETERLLIAKVSEELKERVKKGSYKGKFSAQPLFFGYDGRSCYPTNFDAQYCYALGHVAALLIDNGKTGYMAALKNLAKPVENWEPLGLPLASMLNLETRKGKQKAVIRKALVNLNGKTFKEFSTLREGWKVEEQYVYPGPIQFQGPAELTEGITYTLQFESEEKAAQETSSEEEEPRNFYQTSSTGY